MQRKQFTFYRSYYEAMIKLSPTRRGRLLDMVIRYALDGEEPANLDGQQYMAFTLMRPNLDAARKKSAGCYNEKNLNPLESIYLQDTVNKKENKEEKKNKNKVEIKTEIEGQSGGVCGFEIFWNLFPVKLGKDAARKVWDAMGLEPNAVLPGLHKWLRSANWRRENGRYIPRAVKFLEEEYFRQEPNGDIPTGGTGELGQAELEAIAAVMKGD